MVHGVLPHIDHQRLIPRPRREKTQRHGGARVVGKKRVAGHLLLHEPRVRLVVVERADHVIAVWPRIGPGVVVIISMGVRVIGDIEPVPSPVLSVARGGKQALHELFVCLRVPVGDERLHFLRRWRQSRQIIAKPPDERPPIRLRRWREVLLRQLRENERV